MHQNFRLFISLKFIVIMSIITSPFHYFAGQNSNNKIVLHQPMGPQCLVSPKAPAAVNTIQLADSMGKSFPQNDNLIKVVMMAGSNYYYASSLIAGQLLDISHFHQVFTLLGSNLLKSWNTTSLLKAAVQEFIEAVYMASPLARVFIGSIKLHPRAKQITLDKLKAFNWATRKKIAKLVKQSYAVEYVSLHTLFLNEDGSFKAIARWYLPDHYYVSNYGAYFILKQFLEASGVLPKPDVQQ